MNGAYVGGFFSRIFGNPNQDGVQVMDEAIDLLRDCAAPIEMVRTINSRLAATFHQQLTESGMMSVGAGARESFLKAAVAGHVFVRRTMKRFRNKAIDCSRLDDVEIYAIATILNALRWAEDAARSISGPAEMIQASRLLKSEVGNVLGMILAAKELLCPLPMKRDISPRLEYERYLHESLLPKLPADIRSQPISNFRN